MILEFTIKNFRSIKEETTFSMVAEPSKARSSNIFEVELPKQDKIRVLTTAAIYGPNASGKSNVLRAFFLLINFINSNRFSGIKLTAGDSIKHFDPFLFDQNIVNSPTELSLVFIGPDNIKHRLFVSFNQKQIVKEELSYFPNGKETILYERPVRKDENELIHYGKLGSTLNNKEIPVFHNQLLLSKFGEDIPNTILTNIFVYFNKYDVLNTHNFNHKNEFGKQIDQHFLEDEKFRDQLSNLIKMCDFKINSIVINPTSKVRPELDENEVEDNNSKNVVKSQ